MGSNIKETPKRHTLARVRVVWAIKRENPLTGLTCMWLPENKAYIKKLFVIFHPFAKQPHGRICTKFGTAAGTADEITCTKFLVIVWGVRILWWSKKMQFPIGKATAQPVTISFYPYSNTVNAQYTIHVPLIYTSAGLHRYYCTLTSNDLGQLVSDPLTSWWVWPAGQTVIPVPADWGKHRERSTPRTPRLAGLASTAVVITVKFNFTRIDHPKRSHQHWL